MPDKNIIEIHIANQSMKQSKNHSRQPAPRWYRSRCICRLFTETEGWPVKHRKIHKFCYPTTNGKLSCKIYLFLIP